MSSSYLNEYLILLTKWKDETCILEMIEEIQKIDKVSLTAWNHVLKYYIDEKQYQKGLELYTKLMQLTPKVRPDQSLYTKGITLYGLNLNMDMCLETYLDAEENLNRLTLENFDKITSTEKERTRWKTELNVALFATFLNCLQKDQMNDSYKQFITNVDLRQSKRAIKIYHILFKNAMDVKEYWNDMKRFGIRPDYLIYSRMMSLETSEDRVYEWYRLGNVSFSLSKYNQISYDTTLVLKLLDLGKVEKAYDQVVEFQAVGKEVFAICYKKLLENFQSDAEKSQVLETIFELLKNYTK
jgi:tetratricopeptide (TPR) repeat protein